MNIEHWSNPSGEIIGYQCDGCGLWDYVDKFPSLGTPEYDAVLAEFGIDPETDSVGMVCPGCGNKRSFDSIHEEEPLP